MFSLVFSSLATAIHNLKWLKITHICLIWDQKLTIFLYLNSHVIPNINDFIGK